MIEDMEGARHLQDLAEKIKSVKQLSSEACIFKVHEGLRKTNPEAYTPLTISIGPYHHGKSELRKMERSKELYTQSFLNRTPGGLGVEKCWEKLKDLEGKAKSYYGDLDDIQSVDEDKFVKMLLLDGCFIVEFVIRQSGRVKNKKRIVDPIFMIEGMDGNICRDMLLMENQLPFFVLQALYDMISIHLADKPEFWEMVKCAFEYWLPKKPIISLRVYPDQEIKNLLQLVHILCQPQPQNNAGQIQQQPQKTCSSCCSWKQPQGGGSDIESQSLSNGHQHRHRNWACFLCKFWEQRQQSTTDHHEVELGSIRSASELQEAGVHFKKVGKISDTSNETISLFDIKFNHCGGVLEIPSFALYDPTETFFRNLIAYEQHSRYVRPKYFTDYAVFMADLINTEKDVNILRLKDVFINRLGDDKEVTRLFNNLSKGVVYYSNGFYYNDVCRELNRHCKKFRNVVMAKLRHDYFHSPWAMISTLAAIVLLSLAIAQTVLSALRLHK